MGAFCTPQEVQLAALALPGGGGGQLRGLAGGGGAIPAVPGLPNDGLAAAVDAQRAPPATAANASAAVGGGALVVPAQQADWAAPRVVLPTEARCCW